MPVDLLLGRLSGNDSNSGMISDDATNISYKLEKIHVFARKKLQLSSDNMKTKYDIGFKIQNIVVGSAVWLHKPNRTKLQRNCEGPYVVINKINDVIYRIRKGPKYKPKVVHQDRLKPYKGENPPLWE